MEHSFSALTAPGIVFPTREALAEHYRSDYHRYNLKRRVASLPPLTLPVYEKMQAMMSARTGNGSSSAGGAPKMDHIKKSKRKAHTKQREINTAATKRDAVTPPTPPSDDRRSEADIEREMKEAIENHSADVCVSFFDGKRSDSVAENLEYMQATFGFFIPDSEYITNVEGMLEYCSLKIQVGRTCLCCGRTFRSAQACVQHMVDKGHCKLKWDDDDDLDEYADFYDFSSTWEEAGEEGPGSEAGTSGVGTKCSDNAAAKPSVPSMEVLDSGEMLFHDPDGSTRRVGIRHFRTYYRQHYRPSEQREAVLANEKEKLLLCYRRAGVATSTAMSVVALRKAARPLDKQAMQQRKRDLHFKQRASLRLGTQSNLLVKNRVAKKNVGCGFGVHG